MVDRGRSRTRWALPLVVAAVGVALFGLGAVGSSPATAAQSTFTASADTYVDASTPTTNYGASAALAVDGSPVQRSFVRFTVANLTEPVTSATLRLHVGNLSGAGSSNGGTVAAVADATWSETAVTWNAQPAVGGVLGALGSVARNTWYDVPVTGAVTGNGTFAFAVTSANANNALFDARESGASGPQLVVTTGPTTTTSVPATTTTVPATDPVLLAAGDIASCASSGDEATAALLDARPTATVATTGDNVYDNGTATEFANCYDPTWGASRSRTRPSPGNHDYGTAGATGYYGYFGAAAGDPGTGYYSYDLGTWHVIALNSNCSVVACSAGSAQEQWLRADLAAHPNACTLAYWHHPRFSSGTTHGSSTTVAPLWQALYDGNADVVLEGHEHNYERFAPLDPSGQLDTARGVRSIVVGTGGRSHYAFGTPITGSEVRNSDTFGVLQLTLRPSGYDWQFVPEAGTTFADSGSGACH